MAKPLAFTGARAILRINGKLAAFATDVSYTVETDYKVQNEIDNVLPAELYPNQIHVSVTMTNVRVPNGSPAVELFQPTMLNMMSQPYCTIELRDRGTDLTILYVPKAMLTRRAGRVAARALANETWTFIGLGYWDERGPSAEPKVTQ